MISRAQKVSRGDAARLADAVVDRYCRATNHADPLLRVDQIGWERGQAAKERELNSIAPPREDPLLTPQSKELCAYQASTGRTETNLYFTSQNWVSQARVAL
jgi:ribosome modulation factor